MTNKVFVSTASFKSLPAFETIKILSDVGINCFELSAGKFHAKNINKIKEFQGINYHLHNYFPPPEIPFVINLASMNDKIYDQTFKHILKCIDLSKALGCKYYSFHAGFVVDIKVKDIGVKTTSKNFFDRNKCMQKFINSVIKLSNYAKKNNITLLIENNVMKKTSYDYLGKNTTLMADPEEIDFVMNRVPKNIKFLLDVAHLKVSSNILNFDLSEAYDRIKNFVSAYHLSDNDGMNDTNDPITEKSWFMDKLKKDAFFYTIEVYKDDPKVLLQQLNLVKSQILDD